jgi:hypothetical protein
VNGAEAMIEEISASLFAALSLIVMVFHACLAAGAPWGAASMGGRYPGKYPPKMRWVAVLNLVVVALMAIVVLSRAGLIFNDVMPFARIAIWVVVVMFLAGTVMNTITPSKIERIWAPVALLQFVTSLLVALR